MQEQSEEKRSGYGSWVFLFIAIAVGVIVISIVAWSEIASDSGEQVNIEEFSEELSEQLEELREALIEDYREGKKAIDELLREVEPTP